MANFRRFGAQNAKFQVRFYIWRSPQIKKISIETGLKIKFPVRIQMDRSYNWDRTSQWALLFTSFTAAAIFRDLTFGCKRTTALWVKRVTWIKRCQKLAKVDLCFSFNKLTRWYLLHFLSWLLPIFFHRKKLDDVGAENLSKIIANVQKSWRRSRSGLIFCRMKILTMPRKKVQNSDAERGRLHGEKRR